LNRAQRWFPPGTKIGHTGTLDPLATGVLVLCLGAATRLGEYVQAMRKTYRARLFLGAHSDTDDADGKLTPIEVACPPDRFTIERSLDTFIGTTEQIPPAYSAAHVTGRRAYDLARRGEDVPLEARRIEIYTLKLLAYDYPYLDLVVCCGKGTYIRSLARDLGERLGCGGLVHALRRTQIGPFTAAAALSLEGAAAQARAALLPLSAAVAELPRLVLPEQAVKWLCQGSLLNLDDTKWSGLSLPEGKEIAVFRPSGGLALVARVEPLRRCLRPVKVLIKT
jgi:tRNA pseudouridine55 synthase